MDDGNGKGNGPPKSITLLGQIELDLRRSNKFNIHDIEKIIPDAARRFKEEREQAQRRGILFVPAWMHEGGRPGDYIIGTPEHVVRRADNARRRVPRMARQAARLHRYLQNNPDLTEGERLVLQAAEKKIKEGLDTIDRIFLHRVNKKGAPDDT